jgi:hypothetical protein
MTRRPHHWPALLADFIRARRARAFDWSAHNCAFFACDWLLLVTGLDPAKKYRRRCTNALAAARLLKNGGGLLALSAAAFARAGWPQIPPASARRGDLATTATPEGPALGVVIGTTIAHPGPAGLVFSPLAAATCAWRIT